MTAAYRAVAGRIRQDLDNFDPEQMAPLVRRLPTVRDDVIEELRAFADTLEALADDPSE